MSTVSTDAARVPALTDRSATELLAVLTSLTLSRGRDYLALTKPRIALMVLVTVTVGYALGCRGAWNLHQLAHALLGVALAAAGSSALNQLLERRTDARMPRTADRPLPAGRLQPAEVLMFGIGLCVAACVHLFIAVNPATAALTAVTILLYVGLYTPLKRRTSLCTAVGAVPGALPPVLGWTAAGAALDVRAFLLFGILFLWQFPHFLAIGWMYRDQYAAAGLRMLPARRGTRVVGLLATGYALALIPVSLLAREYGLAGDLYLVTAVLLGAGYALSAMRFAFQETRVRARSLLFSSLIYLPMLLLTMTFDHWRLLQ